MKFRFEHEFQVGVEELERAMFSEDLPQFLKENMASLKDMEVLERSEDDATIRRRVKYVPVPLIEKVGPKRVPPEAMIWVEESTYDKKSHTMTFRNVPTHPKVADLMQNHGTIRLLPTSQGSKRVMEGELKIRVPVLGRVAEKMVFKTAGQVIEEEAAALRKFLSR